MGGAEFKTEVDMTYSPLLPDFFLLIVRLFLIQVQHRHKWIAINKSCLRE